MPHLLGQAAKMDSPRKWVWLLFALAIAAGSYLAWRNTPREVAIVRARSGPAVELVYATGFVEAGQPLSVTSRLTAPVVRVLVDEGEPVLRGQPLVLIDDEDQQALVAQASARSRGSALTERRMSTLFEQGWVTAAARDQAVAAAEADRAAERVAQAHVGQNILRSGIDGIVLKRDVEPGELATPNRILMLLGNPGRMRVTATVDERDMPRVHVGQRALMFSDAWPGGVLTGRVRSITPGGDPTQRAFRIRLALDRPSNLPVGLSLEVNIVVSEVDSAVLVPATAVLDEHVWVVEAGRARRREVRTGIADGTTTQIRSGLRLGEAVITDPPADMRDGERVRSGGQGR